METSYNATNPDIKQHRGTDTFVSQPSSRTIRRLREGLFQLMAQYGDNFIPENHSEWYRISQVPRKTFSTTIKNYQHFLAVSQEYFLQDLDGHLYTLDHTASVSEWLAVFLRYGVIKTTNEKRLQKEQERQAKLRLAVIKYNELSWQQILLPLLKIMKQEHYYMQPGIAEDLFYSWVAVARYNLIPWAKAGFLEEQRNYYRRVLLYYYYAMFKNGRSLGHLKSTLPLPG